MSLEFEYMSTPVRAAVTPDLAAFPREARVVRFDGSRHLTRPVLAAAWITESWIPVHQTPIYGSCTPVNRMCDARSLQRRFTDGQSAKG